jgi:hypothetical protein
VARYLKCLFWLVVIAVALLPVYLYNEARLANQIYRDRLRDVSEGYNALRDQYNLAVRKTAVTELVVDHSKLSVVVRTADGMDRTIETPCDTGYPIHCDYLVMDGRLWIRRVYDDRTAPEEGKVIDPDFLDVDWSSEKVRYGTTVYKLLSDGRWVVSVTGDGSLGLARKTEDEGKPLAVAPPVQDFREIEKKIDAEVGEITVMDVLKSLMPARE